MYISIAYKGGEGNQEIKGREKKGSFPPPPFSP